MSLWLPFFPEIVCFHGFTVTEQIVCPNAEGIYPPDIIGEPPNRLMEPSIGFTVWATSNTNGARFVNTCPIDTAFFSIYGPLQYAGNIGYVVSFGGSFPRHTSL